MRHVLQNVGDKVTDEDLNLFLSLLDDGNDYTTMDNLQELLGPQTQPDLYYRSVPLVHGSNDDQKRVNRLALPRS